MQRLHRAGFYAIQAEYAFRSVALLSRVAGNLHIHRTCGGAFPTAYAYVLVNLDAHQRARRPHFEKHRYGADVFAEGPVVPERERQSNANYVIGNVAADESIEHDAVDVGNLKQQQGSHEQKRRNEQDIPNPPEAFTLVRFGHLVRKAFEHHGRPTGIPAPPPAEQKRAEDLRHKVVDDGPFEDSQKEVVPESRDLHVLAHDEAHEDKHVEAHSEQDEFPRPPDLLGKQQRTQGYTASDI